MSSLQLPDLQAGDVVELNNHLGWTRMVVTRVEFDNDLDRGRIMWCGAIGYFIDQVGYAGCLRRARPVGYVEAVL